MLSVVKTTKGGLSRPYYAISQDGKPPFISPMTECHSIEIRNSDIVADIGAYIGTYSLWCLEKGVSKVFAYEPTPFSFEVTKKNLSEYPNAVPVQRAVVGDKHEGGQISFKVSDGVGVTNGLVGKKRGEVDTIRFSDAIRSCSVIKIDVEGAEYFYDLQSLPDTVRAVIIDFHPARPDWTERAEWMISVLRSQGFKDVITPRWDNGWTRAGSWLR
jgi:FkbM family methyltransferase